MALFGENVQIQCRTNMGATYHWILNGTRLESDQYRVPTPLGQFTIYGLAEEDLGEYVCIAQNEAGIGASHAMVTVGGKNRIQVNAKAYPLLEGVVHVYRVARGGLQAVRNNQAPEIIRTPLMVFFVHMAGTERIFLVAVTHRIKLWVQALGLAAYMNAPLHRESL